MDRAVRILLVDDVPDVVDSLAVVLEVFGYDTCAAYSGEQALGLAGSYRPDAVIIDLNMPGLDGIETTRRLKKDRRLARTTFVAHTAVDAVVARELGSKAGIEHFVGKGRPKTLEKILTALSALPR